MDAELTDETALFRMKAVIVALVGSKVVDGLEEPAAAVKR